jgi:hypothetical protein
MFWFHTSSTTTSDENNNSLQGFFLLERQQSQRRSDKRECTPTVPLPVDLLLLRMTQNKLQRRQSFSEPSFSRLYRQESSWLSHSGHNSGARWTKATFTKDPTPASGSVCRGNREALNLFKKARPSAHRPR